MTYLGYQYDAALSISLLDLTLVVPISTRLSSMLVPRETLCHHNTHNCDIGIASIYSTSLPDLV